MSLFGKRDEGKDEGKDDGEKAAPAAPARHAPSAAPPRATTTTAPSPAPGTGRNQGEGLANIGKSITIKGDLSGNEDLVIEGKVEGKVELPNNQLTIGANGTVKAEVQAKAVIVVGKVAGNVRGTERIEIQATGVVDGDVAAPRLVVAEGAVLNGSIQMTQKTGAAAPAPAPREPVAAQGGAKAAS